MADQLFYLVTFTNEDTLVLVQSAELAEPTMAEVFIPYKLGEIEIGITCYITNKMNWEPAIMEAMILKQYFEEQGLPPLEELE